MVPYSQNEMAKHTSQVNNNQVKLASETPHIGCSVLPLAHQTMQYNSHRCWKTGDKHLRENLVIIRPQEISLSLLVYL